MFEGTKYRSLVRADDVQYWGTGRVFVRQCPALIAVLRRELIDSCASSRLVGRGVALVYRTGSDGTSLVLAKVILRRDMSYAVPLAGPAGDVSARFSIVYGSTDSVGCLDGGRIAVVCLSARSCTKWAM